MSYPPDSPRTRTPKLTGMTTSHLHSSRSSPYPSPNVPSGPSTPTSLVARQFSAPVKRRGPLIDRIASSPRSLLPPSPSITSSPLDSIPMTALNLSTPFPHSPTLSHSPLNTTRSSVPRLRNDPLAFLPSTHARKIDQYTLNPYNDLAVSSIDPHIESLFSELSNRVASKNNSLPTHTFPRFTHCDKSRALIRTMANNLSPSNPSTPLNLTKSQVSNLIAFLIGVPSRHVQRIIDENLDLAHCPPCHPPTDQSAGSKKEKDLQVYCNESRDKLRFFVHSHFREQRRPTVEMVVKAAEYWLQGDDVGRSVSVSSVRRCMRAMGFSWRKLVTRCHMYLNPGVSSLRNSYLSIMAKIRKQTGTNAPYIAYLDETWLYPGMRHSYGWVDGFAEENPFLAMQMGLTPGLEAEFKKGERLVLIGVFSEDGFVHYKVYRTGKKEDESTRDYHGEMNAQVFEAYAESSFPVLAQKAREKGRQPILVIDNAAYHGRRLEKMPTKSSTKWQMIEFLEEKQIPFNPKMKKAELYAQVIDKLDKSLYNIYATEQIAKKHGVRIVRLPPYHCVYSAIELGWAWLKNQAKDLITVDDVGAEAQRKVEEIFDSFPIEKAPSYMAHVARKEQDHIDKGSLTFSHADLDPHAFARAQLRADRDLDTVPAEEETAIAEEERGEWGEETAMDEGREEKWGEEEGGGWMDLEDDDDLEEYAVYSHF